MVLFAVSCLVFWETLKDSGFMERAFHEDSAGDANTVVLTIAFVTAVVSLIAALIGLITAILNFERK
ncbi:hypothetical protein [uncultured Roseobacter sp.]|uniref:hypothetical protein n=1 Tax=uncultured Roseobacter sp. TaxID=114847 RepID=UPI002625223C|nr:hypothetical protein [uncultured Roseobacter sp.]